jgi:putative transposase
MARRKRDVDSLPTIWKVPDELWELIKPILDALDPSASTGRPRMNQRDALNGIIYRMRTGVQWNRLPREFGSDRSIHRTMQVWQRLGVMERIWAVLVEHCEELGGVDWQWQSADAAMGKARLGGIKWARIRRIAAKMEANAV